MGCRTRANEYYAMMSQAQVQQNRRHRDIVEGNVVRKSVPQKAAPVRIKKHRKKAASVSAAKAFARQKARFVALGVIGSIVVIFLCTALLMTMEKSSTLAEEVTLMNEQTKEVFISYSTKDTEYLQQVAKVPAD